jgi:capsular exopolysaccharide synthesis family protein
VQNEAFIMQSRELARDVIDELNLRADPEFNPWAPQPHRWRNYLFVEEYLNPLRYIPKSWLRGDRDVDSEAARQRVARQREERVVDILLSHIDVATLGRSQVLSVKASSETPETAAQIANAVAQAYLRQQRKQKVATIDRMEDYLSKRVDEMYVQVDTADRAVAEYRRDHGIYTTGKDKDGTGALNLTTAQLAQLNLELINAQTAKAEADSRLKEATSLKNAGLKNSGPDAVPDVLKNQLIQGLKAQQAQAEGKLADLEASYGAKHPLVVNGRAEVADLRARLAREMDHVIGSIRQEARTADARYAALTANFERLQKTMAGVNDKSIQLAALERDATVNRNLLEALLSRLREAYGRDALQTADARVISTAAAPEQDSPSYPPKGLIMGFAGLVGLGIGAMLAMTRENIDASFRRTEDVENMTGLPVIATVPDIGQATPPSVQVVRQPISAYAEAIRRLHVGLELSEPEHPPKTVMFASSVPAEGKSVMVASLGRMLAGCGKNILLIDCDWRSPHLHHLFRCPNTGGLAALLEEENPDLASVIHNDELSGLDLIVAGSWDPRSVQRLTSERMRLVLQTFSKNYDMVIIDGPPVLSGAEMLNVARMVEKTCFVVRWGHTRRDIALQGMKQLIDAGADLAGVVLSRVDMRRYRAYAYGVTKYETLRPSPLSL